MAKPKKKDAIDGFTGFILFLFVIFSIWAQLLTWFR